MRAYLSSIPLNYDWNWCSFSTMKGRERGQRGSKPQQQPTVTASKRRDGKGSGSRSGKFDASDLLSFKYEASASMISSSTVGSNGGTTGRRGGGVTGRGNSNGKGHRPRAPSYTVSKAQFMQANFKFILSPLTTPLEPCLHGPDAIVPWNLVECVIVPSAAATGTPAPTTNRTIGSNTTTSATTTTTTTTTTSSSSKIQGGGDSSYADSEEGRTQSLRTLSVECPICLDAVQVPKITSCGHIFCYTCILRHLSNDHESSCKCPICGESIYTRNELKPIVTQWDEYYYNYCDFNNIDHQRSTATTSSTLNSTSSSGTTINRNSICSTNTNLSSALSLVPPPDTENNSATTTGSVRSNSMHPILTALPQHVSPTKQSAAANTPRPNIPSTSLVLNEYTEFILLHITKASICPYLAADSTTSGAAATTSTPTPAPSATPTNAVVNTKPQLADFIPCSTSIHAPYCRLTYLSIDGKRQLIAQERQALMSYRQQCLMSATAAATFSHMDIKNEMTHGSSLNESNSDNKDDTGSGSVFSYSSIAKRHIASEPSEAFPALSFATTQSTSGSTPSNNDTASANAAIVVGNDASSLSIEAANKAMLAASTIGDVEALPYVESALEQLQLQEIEFDEKCNSNSRGPHQQAQKQQSGGNVSTVSASTTQSPHTSLSQPPPPPPSSPSPSPSSSSSSLAAAAAAVSSAPISPDSPAVLHPLYQCASMGEVVLLHPMCLKCLCDTFQYLHRPPAVSNDGQPNPGYNDRNSNSADATTSSSTTVDISVPSATATATALLLPNKIIGRVLEIETFRVTAQLRQRYSNILAHIPEYTQVTFVELGLNTMKAIATSVSVNSRVCSQNDDKSDPIGNSAPTSSRIIAIPPEIQQKFAEEVAKRANRRKERRKLEKREKRIESDRRMAAALVEQELQEQALAEIEEWMMHAPSLNNDDDTNNNNNNNNDQGDIITSTRSNPQESRRSRSNSASSYSSYYDSNSNSNNINNSGGHANSQLQPALTTANASTINYDLTSTHAAGRGGATTTSIEQEGAALTREGDDGVGGGGGVVETAATKLARREESRIHLFSTERGGNFPTLGSASSGSSSSARKSGGSSSSGTGGSHSGNGGKNVWGMPNHPNTPAPSFSSSLGEGTGRVPASTTTTEPSSSMAPNNTSNSKNNNGNPKKKKKGTVLMATGAFRTNSSGI